MLLLVPTVFAQVDPSVPTIVIKQGAISDIKIPCLNSTNSYCDNTVSCNITLNYPNSSVLLRNVAMTNQLFYNNYTLSQAQTQIAGIYSGSVMCVSPTQGSGFSAIKIIINKDGIDLSGNITAIVLVSSILIALLIFFVTMAIILEANLKLVFAGLSFVMLPIVLAVADSIIQDALLPTSIINIVGLGYILSLYMLGAFMLYVMWTLTMGLKLRDNKVEGAPTTETLQKGSTSQGFGKVTKREEEKTDYIDDEDIDARKITPDPVEDRTELFFLVFGGQSNQNVVFHLALNGLKAYNINPNARKVK